MKKSFIIICTFLASSAFAYATQYQWEVPMLPVPGTGQLPDVTVESMVSYIYSLGLALGGFFAFIKLVHAGIQWGGAGGNVSSVKAAQDTMKNVAFGLLLLLGAYALLNTINPEIVNPNISFPEIAEPVSSSNANLSTAAALGAGTNSVGSSLTQLLQNVNIGNVLPDTWTQVQQKLVTTRPAQRKTMGGGGTANCGEITSDMTFKEAGFTCINEGHGNACHDCNTVKFPKELIQHLCELTKSGVQFDIWPGSRTGYSHQMQRAVDIVPRDSSSWDIAMSILSDKKTQCGNELFGPSRYGDRCYFMPYGWTRLDCACTSDPAVRCPTDPSTKKEFYVARSHNSHIHYSVTAACSGRSSIAPACK